jgi:integrase/recombinase XerD
MLTDLIPRAHNVHRSLLLFGPVLDDFDDWLIAQGYQYDTRKGYLYRCAAIERYFRKRKHRNLAGLTTESFQECSRFYSHRPGGISPTVNCLQRFLRSRQILSASASPPAMPFSTIVDAYCKHLTEVRGLAAITIRQHGSVASEFLQYALTRDRAFRLVELTQDHSERFINSVSPRFGRHALQYVVSCLRSFLRFLGIQGAAPLGLDACIDTPQVYRQERLPRALPWDTVCAFLASIDRSSAAGLRDYAMFSLMTAYGLRGCDIAGLKLTDIDWRAGEVHIHQSKTQEPLTLPLTDPVAEALIVYLRDARPRSSYRQLFLTVHAPIAPVKRQSAGYAFYFWIQHSGLDIPVQGVHCLRHSYALHLLRQGVSLKTIGDLLGHRSTQSTCEYLRLNVDDLRDVALPLPPCLSTQETLS